MALIVKNARLDNPTGVRVAKKSKAKFFGANAIYINVIYKKIRNIAANVLNSLATH